MADISVTSTATDNLDILGLDNIKADLKLELPQPFKTEGANTIGLDIQPIKADLGTNSHVSIDPLKTESSVMVDLKPAVVDLCLTLNSGRTPNLCVRQPYRHKIGFTLYGVEVFGFSFSGEQETIVNELGPRPQAAPREEGLSPSARPNSVRSEPGAVSGAGLRIRLDP
jgi:hypothetical protein